MLSYIMANYKELLALGDKVDGSRNSASAKNKRRVAYTLHYVSRLVIGLYARRQLPHSQFYNLVSVHCR
jgi:hypothetical protein